MRWKNLRRVTHWLTPRRSAHIRNCRTRWFGNKEDRSGKDCCQRFGTHGDRAERSACNDAIQHFYGRNGDHRVAVPFISTNPPATAVFRGFTVAPTGGGVVIGAIAVQKLSLALIATVLGPAVVFDFQFLPVSSRPTLINAAQAIGIDFNGATPANAPNLDIYAWWTEAPLNS